MGRTAAMAPSDWLSLIIERAPALRKAGVETLTLDGFSVTLSRAEPDASALRPSASDERDPLFDPASYPGGRVPGYNLTDNLDGEEDPS